MLVVITLESKLNISYVACIVYYKNACIVGLLRPLYVWVTKIMCVIAKLEITVWHCPGKIILYILGNKKFFELKNEGWGWYKKKEDKIGMALHI